jgi:hypothetical protein
VLTRTPGAGLPADLRGFRAVPAPAGRFYADPFAVHDGGRDHLFVEMSRVGRHEGSIVRLTRSPDGSWGVARGVLAAGRHLAYPHVVRLGDRLVLTPDDGGGASVIAYGRTRDCETWEPLATLVTGIRASDPTLVEHAGRLWLFVTVASHGMSPWDELHLYSAPGLDGPWAPHPLNPVVADPRRARPAGRVLRVDGRLLRPGQDCSSAYGRRVVLSEITRLDLEGYEERPVATIEPAGYPGATRTHTYTVDGNIEAVDALVRVPRLARGSWLRRSVSDPVRQAMVR